MLIDKQMRQQPEDRIPKRCHSFLIYMGGMKHTTILYVSKAHPQRPESRSITKWCRREQIILCPSPPIFPEIQRGILKRKHLEGGCVKRIQ